MSLLTRSASTSLRAQPPDSEAGRPPRLVIISPVRDEEATLNRTIACLKAQTITPVRWIVVDDGSTDRTPEILREACRELPWLRVVRRADRGFRRLGGGVIDAYYDGYATIDTDYDFIAKMDVDIEFGPTYLERAFALFGTDPNLVALSGKVFRPEAGTLVEEFIIDEMVAGQFKLYRRDAFERIGGFVREVMWDGIDFHRARIAGFRTASFGEPELRIVHLRLMGSSDRSVYRGRIRWGRGQWFMGSAFPYVLASGLFRMREKPYGIGGLLIIAGYLQAALEGARRLEDQTFQREVRRWQYERLRHVFRGRGPR